MSPYVVHVDWDPPKQRSSKPLMYRLVIMDEFENPLLETDLSNRTYERDELQPATKYKVIYMYTYGPPRNKTCLWGSRQNKTQTNLLSYTD